LAALLAVAAALLFAIGTVLQQRAAMQSSDREAVRAGFLLSLVRKPVWLAGIASDGLGFLAQAAALGIGKLVVVQPLLATSMVFALPFGARWTGQRIGRAQVIAALAVVAGLAAFLVISDPSGGQDDASTGAWIVIGVAGAALTAALIAAGARGGAVRRAATFGSAAGVLFAISAALTKATVDELDEGILSLLTDWHVYALLVVGYASMNISSISLQTGALAPAMATSMTLDPICSVILGVTAFGESIHDDTAGAIASLAGLAAMVWGLVALARAQAPPDPAPRPRE
jgi:drug/metabolite transporter (DMT)-like permease